MAGNNITTERAQDPLIRLIYTDLAKAKSEALEGCFRNCLPQLIILCREQGAN